MDWTRYLFSFEGRINRAKYWFATLIILCWMIFSERPARQHLVRLLLGPQFAHRVHGLVGLRRARIRGYKKFLRMRFDKNGGLTIYSIGLDKVAGRKGWTCDQSRRGCSCF